MVDLANFRISQFPTFAFPEGVRIINLEKNEIPLLPSSISLFSNLTSLKLQHNSLLTLPVKELCALDKLKELQVYENPFIYPLSFLSNKLHSTLSLWFLKHLNQFDTYSKALRGAFSQNDKRWLELSTFVSDCTLFQLSSLSSFFSSPLADFHFLSSSSSSSSPSSKKKTSKTEPPISFSKRRLDFGFPLSPDDQETLQMQEMSEFEGKKSEGKKYAPVKKLLVEKLTVINSSKHKKKLTFIAPKIRAGEVKVEPEVLNLGKGKKGEVSVSIFLLCTSLVSEILSVVIESPSSSSSNSLTSSSPSSSPNSSSSNSLLSRDFLHLHLQSELSLELDPQEIEQNGKIGSGANSSVYCGMLRDKKVAIKKLLDITLNNQSNGEVHFFPFFPHPFFFNY